MTTLPRSFVCQLPQALTLVILCGSMARASDQIPAAPQRHPIAIVGATIHPISGPALENGTIVFDNGKITAIGTNVALPDGSDIVTGTGKHVYPGLMSSATQIGLVEIGSVRATDDRAETGSINPNVRAEAAFNPESELIPVVRANGVTHAVSTPEGGIISGTSAVMMMDGWTWEDMTLHAPAALNISWPSMSTQPVPWLPRGEEETRRERDSLLRELTNAFRDARAYMKAKKSEQAKGIPYHDVDLRWEALAPALDRTVPVVVWADDILQIEAAVRWADREGIRMVLGGGNDAWRITTLLKEHNIPVLVGGTLRLPSRRSEAYDLPMRLPSLLASAGVKFAIATMDDAAHERNLPYHAAAACAYGLSHDEAIRAITLSPAEIFGIATRVGSLEVGKDATLILTTGDPLEITTSVEMEYIQGRKIDLTSRHTMLYDKYRQKYQQATDNHGGHGKK